jgi:hypothetical protein
MIKGRPFVVTLSPEGVVVTLKGKRKGQGLRWEDLVSGDAALAVALNASLRQIPLFDDGPPKRSDKLRRKKGQQTETENRVTTPQGAAG